jgi:heat shock protein HslJ
MEQEANFLAALERAAVYQVQGDRLEFRDDEGALQVQLVSPAERTLEGTSWELLFYHNGGEGDTAGFVSVLAGTQLTAEFGSEGQLNGFAGCNNFSTSYQTEGQSILVSPIVVTMMFCAEPEGLMDQEGAYLAALEAAKTYTFTSDGLEMFADDGTRLLQFQPPDQADVQTSPDPVRDEQELRSVLENLTYPSQLTQSGAALLVEGEYREPAAPDSASEVVVKLFMVSEPHNLPDGREAVLVILVSSGGGSGLFYDLALVSLAAESPEVMGMTLLGDRIRINQVTFLEDKPAVNMITQGPEDAFCCPTLWVEQIYSLEDGELVLVDTKELGQVSEDELSLLGVEWMWVGFVSPVEEVAVEQSESYTLRFFPQQRLSVLADCNAGSGSYTVSANRIDIELGAMTLAACPEGSLADNYLRYLSEAVLYFFGDDGDLFMDLPADAGTMRFSR